MCFSRSCLNSVVDDWFLLIQYDDVTDDTVTAGSWFRAPITLYVK